ncbi:MAG TPA: cysteine desulfurase [Clostridiaceae bacterium]|nr:cysteine desulfurase [Clostridiaceae bacterium]
MSEKKIYLDNAASRRIKPEILQEYFTDLKEIYANPASNHKAGQCASEVISKSKDVLAEVLSASPEEILFTSGGTESINLALKGLKGGYPRIPARILVSKGEHEAVRKTARALHWETFEIELDPATATVDKEKLIQTVSMNSIGIVSLIVVSNETGAVNQIADLTEAIREISPRTKIHLDAVQAVGKIELDFSSLNCDLMSISGHKIGSPKGVGLLLRKKKTLLEPLIHGGGHQYGFRSGTENAPLFRAMARAAKDAVSNLAENNLKCRQLKDLFLSTLSNVTGEYKLLSPPEAVPQIISITFPNLRGETLVNATSARGVYISHGSACSSIHSENPALSALGISEREVLGAVRISLSEDLTEEEIILAAEIIGGEYLRWRL